MHPQPPPPAGLAPLALCLALCLACVLQLPGCAAPEPAAQKLPSPPAEQALIDAERAAFMVHAPGPRSSSFQFASGRQRRIEHREISSPDANSEWTVAISESDAANPDQRTPTQTLRLRRTEHGIALLELVDEVESNLLRFEPPLTLEPDPLHFATPFTATASATQFARRADGELREQARGEAASEFLLESADDESGRDAVATSRIRITLGRVRVLRESVMSLEAGRIVGEEQKRTVRVAGIKVRGNERELKRP